MASSSSSLRALCIAASMSMGATFPFVVPTASRGVFASSVLFESLVDGETNRDERIKGRKRRALKRVLSKLLEVGDATDEFDTLDADVDGLLALTELETPGLLQIDTLNATDKDQDDGSTSHDEDSKQVVLMMKEMEEIEESLSELEPLGRQELRLGGFEPYILVSVLTAQASFGEISATKVTDWEKMIHPGGVLDLFSDDFFNTVILASAGVSTIAGIYATVVFSLTILYGKTALGMDRDDDYYSFMDATGLQRFRAFQAFTYGLFGFSISVCAELTIKCPMALRLPSVLLVTACLVLGKKEYDYIMEAAAPMFLPKTKAVKIETTTTTTATNNNNNNSSSSSSMNSIMIGGGDVALEDFKAQSAE